MCDWIKSLEKLVEGFFDEAKNFREEVEKTTVKAKETGEPQYLIYAGETLKVSANGELLNDCVENIPN